MHRTWILSAALVLVSYTPSLAQQRPQPGNLPPSNFATRTQATRDFPTSRISMGEVQPTEAMWFYEQGRRDYLDPRLAARRRAEARAAERQTRIAARKWFGFSNARPSAAITPTMSNYSPLWTANAYHPHRWLGQDAAAYSVHTTRRVVPVGIGLW